MEDGNIKNIDKLPPDIKNSTVLTPLSRVCSITQIFTLFYS